MGPKVIALAAAALLCFLAAGCRSGGRAGSETDRSAAGADLHRRVLTIDSHAGFTGDPLTTCGSTERQVDFPKMRSGGLDATFFTVYAAQRERTPAIHAETQSRALETFRRLHELARLCSDDVAVARTPAELVEIVESGRLAIAIGVENGFTLGGDLDLVERFAELGASYLGPTHDGHNALADSATPRPELADLAAEHGGLSPLGERLIAELNRLGVMVDVSHMSKAATLDAIRVSRAPVIASHSSMYAIAPHPRNLDDETLLALAAKGGVVQITPVHEFLKVDPPGAMEAFYALLDEFGLENDSEARSLPPERRAEFERRYGEMLERWPLATVADFVDHIDHAVGLVGVDHVGIGSDFEGGAGVTGWMHAGETAGVTAELLRRGYDEEEIRKIWGGNLLRVWTEIRARSEGADRSRTSRGRFPPLS
ncbi:MAG TPA: dipeptidase [Thermoanaerobaculia bacterium]|nr:dipeptidase [Thermoanaerobaculia bacterium]